MSQLAKKVELFFLKHSPWKILGTALKYIISIAALGYVALLLLRLFSSGDTAIAKDYIWTKEALASEATAKEITIASEYSDGRKEGEHLFRLSHMQYTENARQLQVTVRYNDSVEKAVDEEFGPVEGERFLFLLRDNLGRLYTEYSYLPDEKNVLNYRRLVFSGVDTDTVSSYDLLIYHISAPGADEPYAIFPAVFNTLQAYPAARIGTPPASPTAGLIPAPKN